MYSLKSIQLQNFCSYESLEYCFTPQSINVLYGINRTDDGQSNNGSGKSNLIQGISYALTGLPMRKGLTNSELIGKWGNESFVSISLENPQLGEELVINRYLYEKKAANIEIFVNGLEQDKLPGIKEKEGFIQEKIGLSKEEILSYFIISKHRHVSFFRSSDSDKKALINKISKADSIDPIIESLKKSFSAKEQLLKHKEGKLELKRSVFSEMKADYDSLCKSLEGYQSKIDSQVNEIKIQCEALNNESKAHEKDIEKRRKQILFAKKDIEKLTESLHTIADVSQKSKIGRENREFEKEEAKKILQYIECEIGKCNVFLSGLINCPNCNHSFNPGDNMSPAKIKDELMQKQHDKKSVIELLEEIEGDLQKTAESEKFLKKEEVGLNEEISRHKNAILQHESQIKIITAKIEANKSSINRKNREIEELKLKDDSILIQRKSELEVKLRTEKNKIESIKKTIKSLKKIIENRKAHYSHFTSFRNHLTRKSLFSITNLTNHYLEKIKSDLKIDLSGFTELKSGKFSDKISVSIVRRGEETGSHNILSGGEEARIELCIILAISELLNNSCNEFGGLDFLIVDEILESLDSEGFRNIIDSMQSVNKFMILVSQLPMDANDGYNRIEVVKENGISKIEQ